MREVMILSFAKINLSIDVGDKDENGYHDVDMIMHALTFHDEVHVGFEPYDEASREGAPDRDGSFDIKVKTNKVYLPTDERNLAFKAAKLMAERYEGKYPPGSISVAITKRIPVAAGLAGGSGNGAAVLLALNRLWGLRLSLEEMMALGAELGSDVPFLVGAEASANKSMPGYLKKDVLAATCARAKGRGTELTPATPLASWAVIAKPRISVSTAAVYSGIDNVDITKRPDNDELERILKELGVISEKMRIAGKNALSPEEKEKAESLKKRLYEGMINVLEEYTLKAYPDVDGLKLDMMDANANYALMSGSGPTVFGLFDDFGSAKKASDRIRRKGYEAYYTRTIG